MTTQPLIEMKYRNKDPAKDFTAYFKTKEDLRKYVSFIEELIESVKKKTLEKTLCGTKVILP